MLQKIHLKGPYHSQRALHIKELDVLEYEANLLSAAKAAGESATLLEIKKAELRQGAQMMIVAYSEPTDEVTDATKFHKIDQNTLQNKLTELFTTKDMNLLEALYRRFHDLSGQEVEDIMGKMQPVSAG